VLLEPGSVPHFNIFYKKLESVVEPERINYIFVSHQEPDLCTGIPLLEKKLNKTFTILTHTRTTFLLPFYGIKSDYYAVDMNHEQLVSVISCKVALTNFFYKKMGWRIRCK